MCAFPEPWTVSIQTGFPAALFAVHPIHTESVAWGAGRSDVLASCFAVAAVLIYLRAEWPALRRATTAAILVFIAMLAKETASAILLVLPLVDAILGRRVGAPAHSTRAERRRQVSRHAILPGVFLQYIPFMVVFVVYFGLRRAALGSVFGSANPLGAEQILSVMAAVGVYSGKLVLPVQQNAYISDLPTGFAVLLFIGAVLVVAMVGPVTAAQAADMPDFLRGSFTAPVARTNWQGFYLGGRPATAPPTWILPIPARTC